MGRLAYLCDPSCKFPSWMGIDPKHDRLTSLNLANVGFIDARVDFDLFQVVAEITTALPLICRTSEMHSHTFPSGFFVSWLDCSSYFLLRLEHIVGKDKLYANE